MRRFAPGPDVPSDWVPRSPGLAPGELGCNVGGRLVDWELAGKRRSDGEAGTLQVPLATLAHAAAGCLVPGLPGETVLTDDRSSVEWMIGAP